MGMGVQVRIGKDTSSRILYGDNPLWRHELLAIARG
jgi:hypothetical protein